MLRRGSSVWVSAHHLLQSSIEQGGTYRAKVGSTGRLAIMTLLVVGEGVRAKSQHGCLQRILVQGRHY